MKIFLNLKINSAPIGHNVELLRGLRFPESVMDQMSAGYRDECIMDDWWRFLLVFKKRLKVGFVAEREKLPLNVFIFICGITYFEWALSGLVLQQNHKFHPWLEENWPARFVMLKLRIPVGVRWPWTHHERSFLILINE